MKSEIIQTSLSRDFALLSGIILFTLLVLSLLVAWSSYDEQTQRVYAELKKEADRIDLTLDHEIENAGYLLNAIGHQIGNMPEFNKRNIARILQTYNTNTKLIAIWSWADETQSIVVSSNKGILDQPVNISDRDYVHKSQIDPWQLQIGTPIAGRVSDRWVLPVSLGVTDETGRYLGTLTASLDIQHITSGISHIVKRDGISYAIVSKTLMKLTEVSEKPGFVETYFPTHTLEQILQSSASSGMVSKAQLLSAEGVYAYYQFSARSPYILLLGYDTQYSKRALERQMLPRLLQIGTLAFFLLMFLGILRVRVIKPVIKLTEAAAGLTRGVSYEYIHRYAPIEIESLAVQISRVSDYVDERRRVETELREKLEVELRKNQRNTENPQHFVTE